MTKPTLLRSTAANVLGAFVPLGLQLITVPLFLRFIGTERYGALSLVWLLLAYFGLFDLGFGSAIARRIAQLHDQPATTSAEVFWTGTTISLLTGALGGICLFFAGQFLFTNFFRISPELEIEAQAALPWIAASLPVATGISALSGALQGRQAFVKMNIAQTTGMVLYQLAPLAVAVVGLVSIPWLVAAAIAGRLVSAAMLFFYCVRDLASSSSWRFATSEIKAMMTFGGWVTISAIVGPILMVFDRFVIGATIGMAAVAIYSVPYNIIIRVSVLPASWQSALFPRYAMASESESRVLMFRTVRHQAWMMTPIVVTGILLIKPFLTVWVGSWFASSSAPVGQILFVGLWISTLAIVPYFFLQSRGRPDIPAKANLIELCLYAPTLWFLVSRFGVNGAAWAWVFRVTIDLIFLFFAARAAVTEREVRWGFAWIVIAFTWAQFDNTGPVFYFGGTGLLIIGCAVWAWKWMPAEVERLLPSWLTSVR